MERFAFAPPVTADVRALEQLPQLAPLLAAEVAEIAKAGRCRRLSWGRVASPNGRRNCRSELAGVGLTKSGTELCVPKLGDRKCSGRYRGRMLPD